MSNIEAAIQDMLRVEQNTCRDPECPKDYPHDKHDASDRSRDAEALAEAARVMRKYRPGLGTAIAVIEETRRAIQGM